MFIKIFWLNQWSFLILLSTWPLLKVNKRYLLANFRNIVDLGWFLCKAYFACKLAVAISLTVVLHFVARLMLHF